MCLGGIGYSEARTASGVFLCGDGFHVVGVTAKPVPTKVVDFQCGIDRPFFKNIDDPMWGQESSLPIHIDRNVPVAL